ncbi:hypothetical protein DITRI_Ditri06bG0095700 [Diplodiscus trichospermus]
MGLIGFFYQKYWEVLRKDVCKIVKSFFHIGKVLKEINRIDIVLIPKVKNPEIVEQFKHIGFRNFVYKVIAKVMVNRLRPYLRELVTQNHNAVGRQINDNILVAQEVFHYLKLKKKGKKYDLVLKLDMNKAYGSVEWDFLEAVLVKLGFDRTWIKWIIKCISTVSYFLIINENLSSQVSPSKVLGREIPYLLIFLLFVANVLLE